MSEVFPAPGKGRWAVHFDRTAAELTADLAATGYRLVSIKSYLAGTRRLYAASSVENTGVTTNWSPWITVADLKAQLAAEDGRLISLDAFVFREQVHCAAVWVKNDGRSWDWRVAVNESTLRSILADVRGKLTCLRTYQRSDVTGGPFDCAAIWGDSDGRDWDWSADIDFDSLYYRLKNGPLNGQELVSWDSYTLGGKTRFAYVTWRGAASHGWYFRTPVPGPELTEQVRGLCCYPFDVCRTYPDGFGIVQYAYPPIPHPSARTLLSFSGTGTITDINTEGIQLNTLTANVANVSGTTVNVSRAVRFFPGPGGWCWFVRDHWSAANPGVAFGVPAAGLVSGASSSSGEVWNSGQSMAFAATQVEASAGSFQQQEFVTFPLLAAGAAVPSPLTDIAPPAYVGLQGPLEILRMTDNRRLLEIRGQVVNLAGRTMHIRGIHLDLLDPAGKSVYFADLPLKFKLDFDETAKDVPADYDKTNPKHLLSPLPRFHHLIEVPGGYSGGSLEIVLHIQTKNFYTDADPDSVIGTLECFHNRRLLPVAEGEVLQIGSPVKGRFKWGNGPGAADWHTHWYPAGRYAYDLVKVDEENRELKPGTDGKKNEDSLSWGAEIRSASAGDVVFVHDSETDHLPDAALTPPIVHPPRANMIVIRTGNTRFYYAHVQQSSAQVAVGDSVTTGQIIGLIGNNGPSSGPHLHFGAYTHESVGTSNPTGVIRPLAISLTPQSSTVSLPVVVPLDGAYLDTP